MWSALTRGIGLFCEKVQINQDARPSDMLDPRAAFKQAKMNGHLDDDQAEEWMGKYLHYTSNALLLKREYLHYTLIAYFLCMMKFQRFIRELH